jgi:hypothetical protein
MNEKWRATESQAEVALAVFEDPNWRKTRENDETTELLEGMRDTLTAAVGPDVDLWQRRAQEAERELSRAHAAIRWFATVRAVITSGALKAEGEDAYRGLVNILAVAHALTEVWLSGEPVKAQAVADLLGWHAEHSALAVCEWLRPLQTGPYPPLVLDDLRPNI